MVHPNRIRTVSQFMRHLCLLLLIALPFYLAHHWLLPVAAWIDGMPFDAGRTPLSDWPPAPAKSIAGILLTFLPGSCVALALWRLRQLFTLYAQGIYFADDNVALYTRLSNYALAFVLLVMLAKSAISVLLSYDGPAPHISVSFTHAHLFALFGALVLKVITWVMAAAASLERENQSFV
ncbi:DUF2975 domain-containing protein [Parahaliea mediterranea]|uniref:DUF2975 domain-containing protein n=1 Tax=Parahaliea mediterranea TaxID=651086 RepID=UPI001300BAB5|nr:DUF2975 domain-containing protein [Parahaliea mediterranea]